MEQAPRDPHVVIASASTRPATAAAEAAHLRALDPPAYWLKVAQAFSWHRAPGVALERIILGSKYIPNAIGNASRRGLDCWPAERAALRDERKDGFKQTHTFGVLTAAVARFASARQALGVSKDVHVAVHARHISNPFIAACAGYRIGAFCCVLRRHAQQRSPTQRQNSAYRKKQRSCDVAGSAKNSQTNRHYPRAAKVARNSTRKGRVYAPFAYAPNSQGNQ